MKRLLLPSLLAMLAGPPLASQRVDVLLRNGRVVDGAGNPWVHADVGVTGDKITFVGKARAAQISALDTVDASGLLVAPGFWDVHSHADLDQPYGRTAVPLLYQGVTTVIQGVDGAGTHRIAETFGRYQRDGIAVNVLRFVGLGAARTAVMGGDFGRPASASEIERMQSYVAEGMNEGAVGLSTGLAYNPGFYATTDEVVAVARVVARYGGVYDTHDRDMGVTYQGMGYLASVSEAIEIAERAELPLIFSHFNALGDRAHRLVPHGIRLIEEARARGVNVMAGQHVYTASQSSLVAHALPRWVHVGGTDSLLHRLEDSGLAARLDREIGEVLSLRGGPTKIVLTAPQAELNGRSLAELARAWNVSVPDAVRRAISIGGPNLGDMNVDIYSLDNIRLLAQQEWMMTCTDGWTPPERKGMTHPRSYGAFPRKLRVLVREEGAVTLPFAVRGMTSLAAGFFGIANRGLIKTGFYADIVVLDEANIHDRATYESPHEYAAGTVHVLVNGQFVFRGGTPTGILAGRPIMRGGR